MLKPLIAVTIASLVSYTALKKLRSNLKDSFKFTSIPFDPKIHQFDDNELQGLIFIGGHESKEELERIGLSPKTI